MSTPKAKKQLSGLNILLKEVLQLIPEEAAKKLMDGYRSGDNIVLILGPSSHGPENKTAFGWRLTRDQSWRDRRKPWDGIHIVR